jgi:hypothetical protein
MIGCKPRHTIAQEGTIETAIASGMSLHRAENTVDQPKKDQNVAFIDPFHNRYKTLLLE